ncbi:MAG: thiamine diphosphokinase [Oscillospiraceae bacterium]|nr:thiamine diphosphokinase [Oscillospiraceae bacterium]
MKINGKICYIFGAGECFHPLPAPEPGDYVIAADGGYRHTKARGIPSDLVVGDFDSLGKAPANENVVALPAEKDETDTEAAIRAGWERGFRIFYIYGGTGGRIDHTIANIQCVADIARRGGQAFLFDGEFVITGLHSGEVLFPADAKGIISVFAFGGEAAGVREYGLKYPLENAVLNPARPLGVSNEFTGKASGVSVREGTLIIVYPRGVAELQGR